MLRAVGSLGSTSFARSDWAIGQQATVVIPLMAKTLQQRSAVTEENAKECERHASDLASQLTEIAEGRPSG